MKTTEIQRINAELGTNYSKLNRETWWDISQSQPLSEAFIEKYAEQVDWDCISESQHLSEAFIEKHADRVKWGCISASQHLSEAFIEKHSDRVNWYYISIYQQLGEKFIEKHADRVNWDCISESQHLTEAFIEKYAERVNWDCISKYQHLSEAFIEKHAGEVIWDWIPKYQKLSKAFIKKHNLKIDKDNWLYKDAKFKEEAVRECGKYKCLKDYFIAYKAIRQDRYSLFNFQYKYLKGNTYETHADYTKDENSFGFSVWTEDESKNYGGNQALIVRCKIYYRDVARLVHKNNKIRCSKITILD